MVVATYYFNSRFFGQDEINKADIYAVHEDNIETDGKIRYPNGNLDGEKLKKLLITQQNYEKIYSKIMREKINVIYDRVKNLSNKKENKWYHRNTSESELQYKLSDKFQPGSEIHTHVNLLFDNTISEIIQEEYDLFIWNTISTIEAEIKRYIKVNTEKETTTHVITGESGIEGNRFNVENVDTDDSKVNKTEIENAIKKCKDFVAHKLAILSMTRIEKKINTVFKLKIEEKDLLTANIETKEIDDEGYEGGNKKKYRRKRKTTKRNKKTRKRKNKTKKRKRS